MALASVAGCKKEANDQTALVSLNVVNAIIKGNTIKLNTNTVDSVKNYNYKVFTIKAEQNPAIKLFPTNDPVAVYYDGPLLSNTGSIARSGEIYSIYLCGPSVKSETIIVKDNLTSFYADSSIGIRFINLSPNSSPFYITLASNTNVKVFENLGYKEITEFVKFPVPGNTTANSITFQVRNGAGVIQKSYTIPLTTSTAAYPSLINYPNTHLPILRFKNQTLVISGLTGTTTGTDAFNVFPVNNF